MVQGRKRGWLKVDPKLITDSTRGFKVLRVDCKIFSFGSRKLVDIGTTIHVQTRFKRYIYVYIVCHVRIIYIYIYIYIRMITIAHSR